MAQKIFGNNRVFCKGRFISGPDSRSCIATTLMVWVPAIVWQVEVGSYFVDRGGIVVSLIVGALQVASLGFLLGTAFSDPGIMPRQKDYSEQYDAKAKCFRAKQPPRYHDIILRGHPFKLKFCTTCSIYRPPRCTHCSVCENCIERFDHHCPWIGNCIGKRNYWLFYGFITSTGMLNTLVLASSAAHIGLLCTDFRKTENIGGGDALLKACRQEPLTAALVIYCVSIVWFTVGLCLYHNYLICTNQTTYEQIKGVYSNGNNPFNRGIIGNYQDVLGSRVRPRYFDPYKEQMLWPKAGDEGAREFKLGSRSGDWSGNGIETQGGAGGQDRSGAHGGNGTPSRSL
uniref:Palmitoyltransferase n=1 Tax=Alexandrium catenella TaxID=2925 RepID=A0A7S1LEL9_ALECA|mmetsp:Transcript_111755/g.297032  ORF Transcript_111755/g.297032 Transcript_111755/m.297032 type:complete len:343 (+) Transcript_111755:144-1172(+)